jgi:hypothetical protein
MAAVGFGSFRYQTHRRRSRIQLVGLATLEKIADRLERFYRVLLRRKLKLSRCWTATILGDKVRHIKSPANLYGGLHGTVERPALQVDCVV